MSTERLAALPGHEKLMCFLLPPADAAAAAHSQPLQLLLLVPGLREKGCQPATFPRSWRAGGRQVEWLQGARRGHGKNRLWSGSAIPERGKRKIPLNFGAPSFGSWVPFCPQAQVQCTPPRCTPSPTCPGLEVSPGAKAPWPDGCLEREHFSPALSHPFWNLLLSGFPSQCRLGSPARSPGYSKGCLLPGGPAHLGLADTPLQGGPAAPGRPCGPHVSWVCHRGSVAAPCPANGAGRQVGAGPGLPLRSSLPMCL